MAETKPVAAPAKVAVPATAPPVAHPNTLVVPANSNQPTALAAQMPEWLRQEQPAGLAELTGYIVPPRLKIAQKMSRPPFDKFEPGTVIISPQLDIVASYDKQKAIGQPFYFVPVFFFVEWCCWNPLETKGTLDTIRERTFDPTNIVAIKAKNPKLRSEKCPEIPEQQGKPLFIRYVEHLNFVVVLLGDGPACGIPLVMSFARAEHYVGSTFCALANFRSAPLYGCQYMAQVGKQRENAKGNWFGIDCANPSGESGVPPFVQSQETFGKFKKLHESMVKAHKEKILRPDYGDDAENTVEGAVVGDSKGQF